MTFLGDLMQLRPIRGDYIFEQPKYGTLKDVYNIFNLWELFDVYTLEKNHRQGEDKEYAELLNRIRVKGKEDDLSKDDHALLRGRIKEPEDEETTTQIYGYNELVNAVNEKRLNMQTTQLHTIEATHIPSKKNVKVKSSGTIEDTAFLQTLRLKVGARVMLIHNVNTEDGLTNGAQGRVIEILLRQEKVRYILIQFDNLNIGQDQKRKFKFLPSVARNPHLTAIEKYQLSYTLGDVSKEHGARASFLQFPLKLSWASSAHKVGFHYHGCHCDPNSDHWSDSDHLSQMIRLLVRIRLLVQIFNR